MKVVMVDGDTVVERIVKDLKKLGRVVVIEEGDRDFKILLNLNENKAVVPFEYLVEIIEILADLGYDFAILKNFKQSPRLGVEVIKAKSVEEVLRSEDFESLKSILRKIKMKNSERCGAIGIFVGFVRKISGGREVRKLEYEKFDDIYEEKLREIENRIAKYPGVRGVRIYHKSGVILPGEDIVYIAVMTEHRKELWKAISDAMEIVKSELPIWKKEVYINGEIWAHDRDMKNK